MGGIGGRWGRVMGIRRIIWDLCLKSKAKKTCLQMAFKDINTIRFPEAYRERVPKVWSIIRECCLTMCLCPDLWDKQALRAGRPKGPVRCVSYDHVSDVFGGLAVEGFVNN